MGEVGGKPMAKRRSVVLGLGALATGSGAVFASGAFDADALTTPESDFRVIADAGLRVRSARDGNQDPWVDANTDHGDFDGLEDGDIEINDDDESVEDNFSDFETNVVEPLIESPGRPSVGALEIDEGVNDDLVIRTAFSNRIDGSVDPLLEISNNTDTDYEITINYAKNDDEDGSELDTDDPEIGYGDDVSADDGESNYTDSNSDEVSRQVVQEIFQFRTSTEDVDSRNDNSDGTEDLLSPDPATGDPADEGENSIQVNADGGNVFIALDINTDEGSEVGNLVGEINSAAGSGSFDEGSTLDLLDEVYITADEV